MGVAKGLKSMQLPSNFYCLGAREAPLDIRHCPPRPGADEMGGFFSTHLPQTTPTLIDCTHQCNVVQSS